MKITREPSSDSAPRTLWPSAPNAGSCAGARRAARSPPSANHHPSARLLPLIQPARARPDTSGTSEENTTCVQIGRGVGEFELPPETAYPAVSFPAVTSGR